MIKPEYLKESQVFSQDDHIMVPFAQSLGLNGYAREEEIIEAMNKYLRAREANTNQDDSIYVAPLEVGGKVT